MKFGVVAVLMQLVAVVMAYSIAEGHIKIGNEVVEFGEIMTQEIKQLPLTSPKDKIDVLLKLKEDVVTPPHQLFIGVSSFENPKLTTHFAPVLTVNNEIKLSIPCNKLPEVLKVQDKLIMKLIIGDFDTKYNLNKQLVEIIPSQEFAQSSKYVSHESAVGYKPEIHHIFRQEEATINAVIPVAFIGGAVVLFLGLVISWNAFIGKDLYRSFKYLSPVQLSYNVLFFVSIIAFEYNIVQYYLGQSIFATLFKGFVISMPSIYFGSKVLRYLRAQRLAGRA